MTMDDGKPVSSATVPLAAPPPSRRRATAQVALVGLLCLALGGIMRSDRAPTRPAVRTEPRAPERVPAPPAQALLVPAVVQVDEAAPPAPVPAPALVVVDFEHPLSSGRIQVWMDGEELLVEPLRGEVTKKIVLFQLKGGVVTDVLEASPGRHEFRVDVSWDGHVRTESIAGRFDAGETYRLEIRLSRMDKDLSLRWTR
jgi:hypothetical protein